MSTEHFQDHVRKLFVKPSDTTGRLLHAAVGVSGEAGELLDAIKKHWIYGKPLDQENILEECGDALFYLTAALYELGYSLDDAMRHNVEKLAKRYPQGYTDRAAIERADKETAQEPTCAICNDSRFVCENHPDQVAHECPHCKAAGMPCVCHPESAEQPTE